MVLPFRTTARGFTLEIPAELAVALGFSDVTEVTLEPAGGGFLVRPVPHYDLDALLAQVTAENIHEEVSTGAPTGREIW